MATSRLPKPYTPQELRLLAEASADRPDVAAAMVFLRETGLRSAEALSITRSEAATWPRPPWYCRRPSCRRHTVGIRIVGKGDKERTVVLTPTALRAAAVLAEASANGRMIPWPERTMRYHFAAVGKAAGVHVHPHRFRHTHATELVESGVPIEVVADMLGHSRTDITRLYWSASERAKREALGRRWRWLRRS